MRAPDPVITLSPVLDADSSSAHLISLRIPAPIGHQAQHPAPIGRGMAPQVARAQLPVAAARIVSPASISSALASERNIYCSAPPCVCVPCSDIWRIYVGILRPIAPPPSRS